MTNVIRKKAGVLPTTPFFLLGTTFLSETSRVVSTVILNISGEDEHLLLQNTAVRKGATQWPAFVLEAAPKTFKGLRKKRFL